MLTIPCSSASAHKHQLPLPTARPSRVTGLTRSTVACNTPQPAPPEAAAASRQLRKYYHDAAYPNSDVSATACPPNDKAKQAELSGVDGWRMP